MKYDQLINNHLANYKMMKLAITEPENWRGGVKQYHYILPPNKRELNFLSPYRTEAVDYVKEEKIRLHQFFHHLNSSQAMCLNFFYPLIVEGRLNLLLKVLQLPDEPVVEYAFEHLLPGGEKTNFDFYMRLKSGTEVLFEIKYTEKGFGKVTSSARYQKQYNNVYRQMLAGKIRLGVREYEALVKNYQLLRNIAHVEPGGDRYLVFVCPKHNLKLHKEYKNVMDNIVVPVLQKNVQVISWEALLEDLKVHVGNPVISVKLRELYKEFEEKYFGI